MPLSPELRAEYERFESLPVSDETSGERKGVVRKLQNAVRNHSLALTADEFQTYRDGDASIGRILAYLYAESDRVRSGLAERRGYVLSEWEHLQHARFPPGGSTMPLYYAIRSYLTHLKDASDSRVHAQVDEELFRQISAVLAEKGLDAGHQIQGAVKEIISLIEKSEKAQLAPAVAAARLTRRGAIFAAIITASSVLVVGLIANRDKIFSTGTDQSKELPATTDEKKGSQDRIGDMSRKPVNPQSVPAGGVSPTQQAPSTTSVSASDIETARNPSTTPASEGGTVRISKASYDAAWKAPICSDVGGCDSGSLLKGSGPTESNPPNTILGACPDGRGSDRLAIVDSIAVIPNPASPGNVKIEITIQLNAAAGRVKGYFSDVDSSGRLIWGDAPLDSNPQRGRSVLPIGTTFSAGVHAIRVAFSAVDAAGEWSSAGPGGCATGPGDDNDDLVFRVR